MSAWYLGSSAADCAEARNHCERSRLVLSAEVSGPGFFGGIYQKRALPTLNFLKCGEDKWICSAGTLIYNGRIGKEALDGCYSDYATNGIVRIQQNAIGHFALAICDSSGISAFLDPQGSLSLYYIHDHEFWFISNSLRLCASVLPQRKIDSTKLLISAVESILPGEDTFYVGIKRLFGSQAIRIEPLSRTFRVIETPACGTKIDWDFPRIEDAVEAYKAEVQSVFRELAAVGQIGLFGTGGLDSRTVLAGLIDQHAKPVLMYAMGNSKLTDYDPHELVVIREITKQYEIPFRQLDWSGNQPFSADTLDQLFDLYGFDYEIYGAADGFLNTLSGHMTPYPQLLLGGYSPAFTNAKPWQLPQRLYSFDELLENTMRYKKNSRSIADKESYREVFAAEVKIALDRGGFSFPASGVDLETFVRCRLFLYIRAEARFLNLANAFGNYVAPFLLKRLYEPLLRVPFRYRANDEFQIRLIQTLAPGLTAIPLFSGWGPARIDPETHRLIRDSQRVQPSLHKRMVRRLVPSPVREAIRKIRSRLPDKPSVPELAPHDADIVKTYGFEVMNDSLGRHWFTDLSEFSPKEITRIRHYTAAVNRLGYLE
jgi:hypothetical protein